MPEELKKQSTKPGNTLKRSNLNLKVEIEARSLDDVRTILAAGGSGSG